MYWIGKIIGALLHPILWIFFLLLTAIVIKNEQTKKRLLVLLLFTFLFFTNIWIITNIMAPFHDPPNPMQTNEVYEAGIVLGGITSYDRKSREGYFNISSDRFIQTALLYKKGHIKKIIVSGGQNGMLKEDNFSESAFIKKNLVDLGIPNEDIFIEEASRNTIENAQYCKVILKQLGLEKKPIVLITSAFHMQRANAIFKKQGIATRTYPCALSILPGSGKFKPHYLIPSTKAMDWWGTFLKEMVGRVYLSFSN